MAYQSEYDRNLEAALAAEQQYNQQNQPNLLETLGKIALGAGAIAAAGYGVNRLRNARRVTPVTVQDLGATAAAAEETVRRAAAAPPPSRPAPTATRAQAPASVVRQQVAEELTRQARAERPRGTVVANLSALVEQQQPSAIEQLFRESPSFGKVAKPAVIQEAIPQTPIARVADTAITQAAPKALPPASSALGNFLESRGYVESAQTGVPYSRREIAELAQPQGGSILARVPEINEASLVDAQQSRVAFNVDQAINALDAAEDQATGRVKTQLQRNEDLDMSQIEVLEDMAEYSRIQGMEQDEPITRIANQLPDGAPVIQQEKTTPTAQKFLDQQVARQRPVRASELSDLDYQIYDLVGAAGQTGLKIDVDRARTILTDPTAELTFAEQKVFEASPELGRIALRGQTYEPGRVQTGKIMTPVTGASGREQAVGMGERLQEQGMLSKPVGSGELRGLSALDREALEAGTEEIPVSYAETLVSTPETLQQARNIMAKAQSASRAAQMNRLFTSETRPGLLAIRTTEGVQKIPTSQFKREYGPLAVEAIEEAANVEPGSLDYPELMQKAYGESENVVGLTRGIGSSFNQKLAQRGLELESSDPFAAHTLASIARGGAGGSTSLSEYAKRAARMEARGISSRTGNVPTAIPGPSPEAVTRAVAASTDPYQGRGTYTTQGVIQPAVQPRGGLPALDILEARQRVSRPVASASPLEPGSISSFYREGYENPAQEYLSGKLEEQMARMERQQAQSSRNLRRFGII